MPVPSRGGPSPAPRDWAEALMPMASQYTFNGPSLDMLNKKQVAAYFDCGESTLDRLIGEGRFPGGIKASRGGTPLWPGWLIAAWATVLPHLKEQAEEKGGGKDS